MKRTPSSTRQKSTIRSVCPIFTFRRRLRVGDSRVGERDLRKEILASLYPSTRNWVIA